MKTIIKSEIYYDGEYYCASMYGFKVEYYPCSKLFAHLKLSRADGSYLKELTKIQKLDIIILDDFGLEPLDVQSRLTLLEIFEDRHRTEGRFCKKNLRKQLTQICHLGIAVNKGIG